MADEEEENFPPEVQILPSKFTFREIHPLRATSSDTQPEYATIRSNLLAIANIYGYVFVGLPDGLKVYRSSDILEAGTKGLDKIESAIASIDLRNPPNWIGINSNNLTLAVCCTTEKGPQILFFDLRNIINKAKPTKTPFHSLSLNKNPNSYVTSMCWNPSSDWPNLLAICVSSGSFHLFSIENTATEIAIRPDNFGASTVCWSPKGIQMIVGKKDGTLHQFTQKLEVRRSITVSGVIDRPVRAGDILWLSTHQITTAYTASDVEEDNFMQPNLFLADIPSKNEQREIMWKNYEDPCFGYNESRDSQYYFTFIDQWQMFIALSSNSTDSAVIAKNNKINLWEIWSLDDSSRATLPLSQYTGEDSSPLGSAILTTAKDRIVVDDTRECGPQPVLVILSNDGVLCMFHMINLMPEYSNFVSVPQSLDVTGERTVVGSKSLPVGGGDSTGLPTSSTKQKLTAKPSISPMMTPKIGLNQPGNSFNASSLPMPLSVTKSQFSASTPIVGKPPPFSEGPSIIQGSSLTPQPKPPLMREMLLKATPFTPQKHQALDETTDTVFDPNRTGSSESVFAAKVIDKKVPLGVKVFPKQSFPPQSNERKPEISKPITESPKVTVASMPVKILPTSDNKQTKMPLTKTKSSFNGGGFSGSKFATSNKPESFPAVQEARSQPPAPVSMGRKIPADYKEADSDLTASLDDVASFEKELRDFQSSIFSTPLPDEILGGSDEKLKLQKEAESLTSFSREISKTAHELNNEIQESSTSLLSLISETKDVGRKQNQANVGAYRSLLYSRPLDRTQRQKMEAIQGLYQYVVSCVREANIALDAQWEEANKRKQALMGMRDTRKGILQMGEWEAAYQGLKNNMKILHNQEMQVMLLSQQLYKLRLDTASHRGRSDRLTPIPETVRTSDDLRLLADTLLLQKTNESASEERKPGESSEDQKLASSRKLSPKKQAQLGQILANRKVAPVRSSGRSPSSITRPMGRRLESQGLPSLSIKSKSSASKTPSESISPLVEESPHESISPLVEESPQSEESTSASEDEKTPDSTSSSAPSDKGFMFGDPVNQNRMQPSQQSDFGQPPRHLVQVPTAPFSSMIPQGSATLAYGAPTSVMPETKRRELSNLTASNIEAASNLNNPPQVVNIQKLQEPDPVEASLPEKFEPKSEVPAGAIEVVQAVINTVKAEKQQKPKEWKFSAGAFAAPTVTDVTTASFAATDTVAPGGIFQLGSTFPGNSVFGTKQLSAPSSSSNAFPSSVKDVPVTDVTTASFAATDTVAPGGIFQLGSTFPGNSVFGTKQLSAPSTSSNAFPSSVKEKSGGDNQKQVLSARSSVGNENQLFAKTTTTDLREKNMDLSRSKSASAIPQTLMSSLKKSGALTSSTSVLNTAENATLFGQKPDPVPITASVTLGSKPSTPFTAVASVFSPKPGTPVFTDNQNIATALGTTGSGQVSQATSSALFGSSQSTSIFGSASVFSTTSSGGPVFGASQSLPTSSSGVLFGSESATPTPVASTTTATISTESNISGLTITSVASLSGSKPGTPVPTSVTSSVAQVDAQLLTTSTAFNAGDTTVSPSTTPSSEDAEEAQSVEINTQSTADIPSSVTSFPNPVFASSPSIITSMPSTATPGTVITTQPVIPSSVFTSATSGPGGIFQAPAATTAPFSGSSVFQPPPESEQSGQGLFGAFANQTSQPAASSSSLFGNPPATENTTSQGGLFGGFSSPAFGSTPNVFGSKPTSGFGAFGSTNVFGSGTPSTASATTTASQPVFGASSSVFGASSTFGSATENKSVFGGDSGGFGSKPAFGSTTFGGGFGTAQPTAASQPSAFGGGGGFFSGLGGKPSQDAASKNPFQVGGTSDQEDKSGTSLFGNSGAKSFQGFGQAQQPSAFGGFGTASGGVASQGFGGFNKPQQSGFGAAPAFGSTAAFGSPPSFGSSVSGRVFGGGFGSQPESASVFGQSTADSGGGGFASFANNEAPGFGNIASGGFGSPQPSSNAFGSNTNAFGADSPKSPSFSGWR